METARPFIIWTLQRTGGTNLARRLFERSGLLEAARARVPSGTPGSAWLERVEDYWKLHEPLNNGKFARIFGSITDAWTANGDRAVLDDALGDICSLQLPMKHCVEMIPLDVSEALARASHARGYRHLFLYRKNPLQRLLSLHFARLSGIWGPEMNNESELQGRIFSEPLPVAKLVEQETRSVQRLTHVWNYLKAQGASPVALAFEDIYQNGRRGTAAHNLVVVLELLSMSRGKDADLAVVSEVLNAGDQGTKDKYGAFSGIEELEAALSTVPRFSPSAHPVCIEMLSGDANIPGVLHATVDWYPAMIKAGTTFDVGGVVVLADPLPAVCKLLLVDDDGESVIEWHISSPKMAKEYPGSANGARARFKARGLIADRDRKYRIVLETETRLRRELFQLAVRDVVCRG